MAIIEELVTVVRVRTDQASIRRAESGLGRIRRGMQSSVASLTVVAAAVGGVTAQITRTLLGFERAQNRIAATFGDKATLEDLQALEDQARSLGGTTSKSATEAANAQVELARAGLEVNDVLSATPHVLDLAIAGELSMAQAAGLVTGQVLTFGEEMDQTNRFVDVFARLATSSKTTVAELGTTFRQVSPIAAALGFDIEKTSAALGVLRTSLPPEQAGTALRNIFAIFQEEPTDRITSALNELGLDFNTLQDLVSRGDLATAFEMLNQAGLDGGTAFRIFGREASAGALLLARNVPRFRELEVEMRNSTGAANEMREIMERGLPGAFDRFKSSAEAAQLAIGEHGFTGAMMLALKWGAKLFQWFVNTNPVIKVFVTSLLVFATALVTVGTAWRLVVFAAQGFRGLVLPLFNGVKLLTIWLWKHTFATRASTASTVADTRAQFFRSMGMRTSTAATIRSTIATKANTIAQLPNIVATKVLTAAQWFLTSSLNASIWARVASIATVVWERTVMIASAIAKGAYTAATWLATVAAAAFGVSLIVATGGLILLIPLIIAAIAIIWKFRHAIIGAIKNALDWVKNNWKKILPIILGPLGLLILGFLKYKDQIFAFLQSIFGRFEWLGNAIGGIFDWLGQKWEDFIGFFKDTVGFIGDVAGKVGKFLGFGGGSSDFDVPDFGGGGGSAGFGGFGGDLGGGAISSISDIDPALLAPTGGLPPAGIPQQVQPSSPSISITIDNITLTMPEGATPDEIGKAISRNLRDQMEDAVENSLSPVVA